MKRRLFILDDHPITRYGLQHLINGEADLEVCGEAESAQAALEALPRLKPDLVLADITIPGKNGLDFIKDARLLVPDQLILVMSMHDEAIWAERILHAGGRGYIMKSEGGEKLLEAIRQVLRGEVYVSHRMSVSILDGMTRPHAAGPAEHGGLLTDREFEVFQLIGQGLSSQEIGQRLSLSVKTVGTHRLHIKEKLRLRSGPELVRQAVRWAASQQLV